MSGAHLHLDDNTSDATSAHNALLPQHAAMLKGSAISDEVSAARGYRSITNKAELQRLGFSPSQLITPTLVIPIFNVSGEEALRHHRPDTPRIRDGKVVKYEFPRGEHMVVDVHPSIKERVRDPNTPLFITEGVKKADAATSRGLCCIALVGTWNWRGTNEYGGRTALPDWDTIALKHSDGRGRQVFIAYDSDVMLKPQVHQALQRLSAFLKQRGATLAYIYLPAGDGAGKVGLDDYLAAGHSVDDLLALATPELRQIASDEPGQPGLPYRETSRGIVHMRSTNNGVVEVPLTNFTAHIIHEVVEDDGAETNQTFEIEAHLNGRTKQLRIPAQTFSSMNWVTQHMGAAAIVYPGMSVRDHARAAIQFISGEPPQHVMFKHTGWREMRPGYNIYLHAGGAIGDAGTQDDLDSVGNVGNSPATVQLDQNLARFILPPPPQGEDLRHAVSASLRMLELGPTNVCVPVFAAIWRAAVASADFSLHLAGASGTFKTELAALAQQHYGVAFNSRNLPAAWSSTENALEALAFAAKDALLVIDDYAPYGSASEVQRLHAKADRVLRAQGNNSGRQRMRPDGSLRSTRPPRGLILSTGEDIPPGQSLRARMLVVEVSRGDIDAAKLTSYQQDAAAGLYAQAMSGYLSWLAPRYREERDALHSNVLKYRAEAGEHGAHMHRRTPEITANLMAGISLFLRFAVDVGAIPKVTAQKLTEDSLHALITAEAVQVAYQVASEPAARFIELIAAAIASERAHVSGVTKDVPDEPAAWGWRGWPFDTSTSADTTNVGDHEWYPRGGRIGWVDLESDDLYLIPAAAYRVAKAMIPDGVEGISVTQTVLAKRLKERGYLKSTDQARQTLYVRRVLAGKQQQVLHLAATSLYKGTYHDAEL